MPNIIANDILGVQSTTAQLFAKPSLIWQLTNPRFMRYPVNREIYKYFLRLYNRRKTQGDRDFANAGYYNVTGITLSDQFAAKTWCQQQFGQYGFQRNITTNNWWFVTEEDAALFKMTWL